VSERTLTATLWKRQRQPTATDAFLRATPHERIADMFIAVVEIVAVIAPKNHKDLKALPLHKSMKIQKRSTAKQSLLMPIDANFGFQLLASH
jgi:hypothetical protein